MSVCTRQPKHQRGRGHGLSQVTALRPQIERAIELLISLLDRVDGDCEDEGSQCEDEGTFDSGIGDYAGLMEQWPHLFQHCYERVE